MPVNSPYQFSKAFFKTSSVGLAILLLGGFITVFDLFVVNVAVPSMQSDLKTDFADIGLVIAGYELAFGVLLIASGRLGDRHGYRKLFVVGMIGFSLTSLLCGLAPNSNSLIVARFLQGATGAILFPQVYSLFRIMFDEKERRRAFGLLGMTLGFAAIAGQVIGGYIVESNFFGLGWRTIFLLNLPIGLLIVLFRKTLPESRSSNHLSVDWFGIALATAGLLFLLLPLLEGPNSGWPTWTKFSILLSAILLAAFVFWEQWLSKKGGSPAIDLNILRQTNFSLGSVVVLLIYSTSTSLFLCFALLVQSGFKLTPFEAGTLFAPASVGFIVASLMAPKIVIRIGNIGIFLGMLVYAAGIGWLVFSISNVQDQSQIFKIVPALILFGFGQGISMTPLLNLVIGYVEESHAGMAAGFISTMQQIGGAFGVSVVGIFFVSILNDGKTKSVTSISRYVDAFSGAMIYNISAIILASIMIIILNRSKKTKS